MSMEDCLMCGSPIDECECEDAIEQYTDYIDAQRDIAGLFPDTLDLEELDK